MLLRSIHSSSRVALRRTYAALLAFGAAAAAYGIFPDHVTIPRWVAAGVTCLVAFAAFLAVEEVSRLRRELVYGPSDREYELFKASWSFYPSKSGSDRMSATYVGKRVVVARVM